MTAITVTISRFGVEHPNVCATARVTTTVDGRARTKQLVRVEWPQEPGVSVEETFAAALAYLARSIPGAREHIEATGP